MKENTVTQILIIDDDAMLRRVMSINLTNQGHDVLTAGTGGEGLKSLSSEQPDVVLLDLGLPDVDGLDLITTIRADLPALPIIVVSGRRDTGTKITARERGADSYLTKPFATADLLAGIAAVTRR